MSQFLALKNVLWLNQLHGYFIIVFKLYVIFQRLIYQRVKCACIC